MGRREGPGRVRRPRAALAGAQPGLEHRAGDRPAHPPRRHDQHAEPWLAWLDDGTGAVAGVALRTPPRGLLIPPLPDGAAAGLAEVAPPELPGAAGPTRQVTEFTAAYAARAGATPRPGEHLRLYELPELRAAARAAGAARIAEAADVDLCDRWFADFVAETGVQADGDPRRDPSGGRPGPPVALAGRRHAGLPGRPLAHGRRGQPDRPGVDAARAPPARVRGGPDRRGRRAAAGSRPGGAVRRPGQPHLDRRVPADRLPTGRRLGRVAPGVLTLGAPPPESPVKGSEESAPRAPPVKGSEMRPPGAARGGLGDTEPLRTPTIGANPVCGLLGFLSNDGAAKEVRDDLAAALDMCRHRGPDEGGVWYDDDVVIGFRRLSIIDIDHSPPAAALRSTAATS